jgi:hypothetical protein
MRLTEAGAIKVFTDVRSGRTMVRRSASDWPGTFNRLSASQTGRHSQSVTATFQLRPPLGNALIMESLGTADADFFDGLLGQLVNVGAQEKRIDERGTNFMLAMIRGIGPRDEVEAMMAAQMAAVHMATMTFARRLAHVDNIPQQDSAERAFNKLARTFAVQLEALKRYRTGGEQKVTVQHVTVNEGGQAIVGSVSPGVGGATHAGKS